MLQTALNRLDLILQHAPNALAQINALDFAHKVQADKWSKKETLGHLIDSASNNHQRFIRAQFETAPAIRYDQNQWNACGFYQDIDTEQLISFWTSYNKQLLELAKRIPAERLANPVKIGENMVTLEFVITDYVEHLEHHLKQIMAYQW